MDGWMMTIPDIEDKATHAVDSAIAWLHEHEYLTREQYEDLQTSRLIALYKPLSWYTKLWKKLWPKATSKSYGIVIVRLPRFEDPGKGDNV